MEDCNNGIDDDLDGQVDCNDHDCCGAPNCMTNYSEGKSSIKFKYNTTEPKDKASLRMCINTAFCNALKGNPVEIVVQIDGCDVIVIPGGSLKANKSGTKFSAKSPKWEIPGYSLKVDCEKGALRLSLKYADLKDCVSNPVKTCVYIKDGQCLCAEWVFEEKLDKEGNPKSLSLSVAGLCPVP